MSSSLHATIFIAVFVSFGPVPPTATDRMEGLKRLVESGRVSSWRSVCPSLGVEEARLCRRVGGLPAVLKKATTLADTHCRKQFKYQRWNCTYSKNTFDKVTRESGILAAVYTSAVAYSVARACSEGLVSGCQCGSGDDPGQTRRIWSLGACPHNLPRGRNLAKRILRLHRRPYPPTDIADIVYRHNSLLGLRVLNQQMEKVRKCHGVSGSCTMSTTWKRLPPFKNIVRTLKRLYFAAVRFELKNTAGQSGKATVGGRQLMYVDPSEEACPGTRGRRCLGVDNCSVLCCARGYRSYNVSTIKRCNCNFNQSYQFKCNICRVHEKVHFCK